MINSKQKSVPLYIQLREYIESKIDSNELKPGDQIPIESELVTQFKISRRTVKSALNQLVEKGVIFRIAGKGSFVAMNAGIRVPNGMTGSSVKIGYIKPGYPDLLITRLLLAIEKACQSKGYILMIKSVFSQEEETQAIRDLIAAGAEGLIIYLADGRHYNDEILNLKSRQFPFVLVDRYLPSVPVNSVTSDNYQGGVIGTEYLAQFGHTQIGIISNSKSMTTSTDDRFQGYMEAAKKLQLPVLQTLWCTEIETSEDENYETSLRRSIFRWLDQQTHITAVFSLSYLPALYTIMWAESKGKKIPNDFAVLAFDNLEFDFRGKKEISFIEQNYEEMGSQAVDLMQQLLTNPLTNLQITIPISLQQGHSTLNQANEY